MKLGYEGATRVIKSRLRPAFPTFFGFGFPLLLSRVRSLDSSAPQPLRNPSHGAVEEKQKDSRAEGVEEVHILSGREDLEKMIFDGVLPDEATASWHPAAGERYPDPQPGELVVFEDCFYRWFGLPAHPFVRKFLSYYGILHIHLHPQQLPPA